MEKVEKQIKIRRYHICGKMEKIKKMKGLS